MKARLMTGPRIIGGLLLAALALAIFVALREPPTPVDMAEVGRGPLTVTVDDEGETRVADLYVVSAPLTAHLLRVPLKPGDPVVAGRTVVARLKPVAPDLLSARRNAEIQATIQGLEARRASAEARVREARAARQLALLDFSRTEQLSRQGFASKATLDRARAARDQSTASVAEAAEAVDAIHHELEATRAQLIMPGSGSGGPGTVVLTSPVGGTVLRVPQESERVVPSGTPLVEIGDPDRLEIVTDLLSADAVQVRKGAPVLIESWGGEAPLKGRVRLVEPFGFTKISALGVEEQRVNVVIAFAEPRVAWARLGHGYRVIVRIVVSSAADVIRLPVSALFRTGNRWSVFGVDADGKARLLNVEIGRMNDESAEVLRGLRPGERVILHPGDQVMDGRRVEQRS